jgi:hypothetical protein
MLSYELMWWLKESFAVLIVAVGGRAQWLEITLREITRTHTATPSRTHADILR